MNPSVNASEQQGESNWATGNWDQSGSVAVLESTRPFPGNRPDWDWDSSMILGQHSGGGSDDGDADRKSPMSGTRASNLRPYTGILSSGFPSNFSQNPMGIFSSVGLQSYGGMDSTSIATSSGLHEALSSSTVPGIPGLAPTSGGHGDMRSSFEQRRRQYFGAIDTDLKSHSIDVNVKRESDICGNDGRGPRIGLNLGVRTYFSTEDTAPGRFGKRHRSNSPGLQSPMCQAEGCKADLSTAKHYHRRHKVCEQHSKAANVIAAGYTQRFCQQCSRFHILSEFDEGKRSCRKRLADHNRRRRKPQPIASTSGGCILESVPPKIDEHSNSTCGYSHEAAAYQHFLDGVGGPAGTNLSLSSCVGAVGIGSLRGSCGLSFSAVEPPVPWLIPSGSRPDTCQPDHGRPMNTGHLTSEQNARGLHHAVESCSEAVGQVYSTSIQNLLPSMQSREMAASEWILGHQDDSPCFISSNLSNMSRGQLGVHQFNPLGNREETRGGPLVGEQGRALEFLQQNGCEGLDDRQPAESHPKFPELQALKPGSFDPIIYGTDHNL